MYKDKISLIEFHSLLEKPNSLDLDLFDLKLIEKSYKFLLKQAKSSKLIYGYNTGFGAFGNNKIPNVQKKISQQNLIYHLATGIGERFTNKETLAILLARILSLSKGFSGISPNVFKKLIFFFQKEIIPHVPQVGTVGASGDLTPLAHLTLSYMGESIIYWKGEIYNKREFFEKYKISPLNLIGRDGLALVNGTSASCGISSLNVLELEKALRICLFYSFLYAEIFQLSLEYYSRYFYDVKQHEGFLKVYEILMKFLKLSPRISQKFLFENKDSELLQPSYCLRASIQILGSVYDLLKKYFEIVEIELNSVSDNPLFFVNDYKVIHGANFYASHLTLVNDGMRVLIHQLANLSERRIAKLTDPNLNLILPKFLIQKSPGVNSGFMGAQVTSTSILAEIRNLASPSSLHSIPTNANNQDVIPLSSTSSRFTRESIKLLFYLLAIESLVLAQAIEILGIKNFSQITKDFWTWIRNFSPFLKKDRSLSKEIEVLAENLKNEEISWNVKNLFLRS